MSMTFAVLKKLAKVGKATSWEGFVYGIGEGDKNFILD